jgi:hypothetical protein
MYTLKLASALEAPVLYSILRREVVRLEEYLDNPHLSKFEVDMTEENLQICRDLMDQLQYPGTD